MSELNIAQKTLRIMRVLHAALLLATVAYVFLSVFFADGSSAEHDRVLTISLGVVAMASLAIAAFYRARLVQPASEKLRATPDDASAAGRWRQGVLLSLVFSETVVLFGMALRFVGGAWQVCAVFFAAGIFFLLAWTPKLELPPT